MSETIKYDVADRIATITLNRPERMNAFTWEMTDAWADALIEAQHNEAVHVVIVTGAGKAFCSGGDIQGMGERQDRTPLQRKEELAGHVQRIPLALEAMDKPVIAAINGAATGAGMDLALQCDLRFAASSARLGEPRHAVVIGQRENPHAVRRGPRDELLRLEQAVGSGRVTMQIDIQ